MISKEEIENDNDVIAKFLETQSDNGYKYPIGPGWCTSKHLQYHNNWNWIIVVVEKIEAMTSNSGGHWGVYIHSNCCVIQDTKWHQDHSKWYWAEDYGNTKIEAVWLAVVKWIQWYNNNVKDK